MNKRNVAIGLLGSKLDTVSGNYWRPTVSLCLQKNLPIYRLELLHQKAHRRKAQQVAQDIRTLSPTTDVCLHEIPLKDPWDFEEAYSALLEFALGYQFKPEQENYFVHISTGTHVTQICLFMLTESQFIPAQLIQTSQSNQRPKDITGHYRLINLDLSRYDKIATRFRKRHRENISQLKGGIPTRNLKFNAMIAEIEEVVLRSPEPILLLGPTGAGKSRLAKFIYDLKKQEHQLTGPFVEVNCATLRGEGAMSTLFGHCKGAYTGANAERRGLLKSADGGMLLLDEIGCLGMDEQAMLLRAIEDKAFYPLGSDTTVSSQFFLIAGTNSELDQAVLAGSFREDLLARIDCWTFRLPPLKERMEDFEPNLNYEVETLAHRLGHKISFNKEARDLYLQFAASEEALWTKNFRDLNKSVIRLGTLASDGRINVPLVKREIERLRAAWQAPPTPAESSLLTRYLSAEQLQHLDLFDCLQLEQVLQVCLASQSLSDAGAKLYPHSRLRRSVINDADRLRKYLTKYGIKWQALFA